MRQRERERGRDLLSNLGHVSSGQNFQVLFQGTVLESSRVQSLVVGPSKLDVVSNCCILDPRLLGDVGHSTLRGTIITIEGFVVKSCQGQVGMHEQSNTNTKEHY